MNHHEDYSGLLKALREAPDESIESISVNRAIHDGRRTIRRRRVLGGAAVVGLVGVASSVRPLLGTFRDAPVAGPPTYEPLPVWERMFDVGKAGGFQPCSYLASRRFHLVGLTTMTNGDSGGPNVIVTLYARGLRSAPAATIRRLDDVAGRPAYVLLDHDAGATITWEYADGAWGTVAVNSGYSDRVQRGHRVAQNIHRRPVPAPLTVPFTIPRRTVGLSDDVVMVNVPYGYLDRYSSWEIGVAEAEPTDPDDRYRLPTVAIRRPRPGMTPNTTIAGRRAYDDSGPGVTVFGIGSGYSAQITAPGRDEKAIAAGITLIGDPSDPAKGTDEPLR
ncbi:hypothetical protein ACFCV3_34845 [Kribbella sp. NPDC056345]|uniref:hypothetical protein n=1 Tax=Kribbella sp. NPDC056345 TaxID=3345789 RepID=UPI0035DFC1FC